MLTPRSLLVLAMASLVWVGCGGEGGANPPDAAGLADAGADAAVDPSAPTFAPGHIVEVAITLDAADWNALRLQTRSVAQIFGTCLMEAFDDPFTYFPATVTIDGQTLAEVGVRKKGFLGSLDPDKPSLRIKFDEYVEQRYLGLKAFTLNNSKQDPSFLRQCLTYRTFSQAGIPASRCNFAHVTVNGQDLGLFVHVESGSKQFLERHFDDPDGNLYEGTLSDFRQGWTATFELKTNEDENDRRDLEPLVAALELPDDELLAALEPLVDIDQFLDFWATEILVAHWDGYAGNANNFFAYNDPVRGKFVFMPWGADGTFVQIDNPFGGDGGTAVQANALLARRLYLLPATRARYLAALEGVLARAWNEAGLLAEIDRMEALITPIVDPQGTLGLAEQIDSVRGFVRTRRASIAAQLEDGPPAWTTPLRDAPCFEVIGDLAGEFATTWGTVGAENAFETGSGAVTGTINELPLEVIQVGATAGEDPEAAPKVQLAVIALRADGSADIIIFQVNPDLYGPDRDLAIDWENVLGVVYHYTPSTQNFELTGLFLGGTLHLDAAGTTSGQAVTGSFSGDLIRSPF